MAAHKDNDYTLKRKKYPQYTEQQLKEIADDLLDYAENAKSIHLAPWCRKRRRSTSWLNKLAEKHQIIADAHKQAKVLLGAKVLNSSFYGEGNATVGMSYLPLYDLDYKALLKYKEEIKQKNLTENEANIIVQAVNYAKDKTTKNN